MQYHLHKSFVKAYRKLPDKLKKAVKERLILFREDPFLKELNNQINDVFLELAVSIIYFSKIECSDELIKIIRDTKRAYVISLLCMLLGFFENNLSEKLLWDYFHFFKEKFPNKSYAQGPLLGLIELFNKRTDRKINAILH